MIRGERIYSNQKYSITKKGQIVFIRREHLDDHIPQNKKIVFQGFNINSTELKIINSVIIAEKIANIIALKKKNINITDEWELFINGDIGYNVDLANPYELRLNDAYKFIKQNLEIIPDMCAHISS